MNERRVASHLEGTFLTTEWLLVLVFPPIIVLIIGAYRSYFVAHTISENWQEFFLSIFAYDCWLAGLLTFSLLLVHQISNKALSALSYPLSLVLLLLFLLDVALTIELNQRLNYYDVLQFLPEIDAIRSFIAPSHLLTLFVVTAATFCSFKLSKRAQILSVSLAVICCLVGLIFGNKENKLIASYSYSILNLRYIFPQKESAAEAFRYSDTAVRVYKKRYEQQSRLNLLDNKQSIILLIIESLSSFESKKISGVKNHIPRFDRFTEKGLLFPNFFANHEASEGGIQSLLSGFPPLPFPMSSRFLFREFSKQDALISEFKKLGFHTEFITTNDIKFVEQAEYLKGVGFDRYVGRDQVEEFRAAPRVVQFAPSDDHLYREALSRIDTFSTTNKSPFLMVLSNVSSHPPYRHPYTDERKPEVVWDWVIEQIELFHDNLLKRGFFDNGLLIITADHRRMVAVRKKEVMRYGDSAKARIPLLIIGTGIPEGRIDRRFYQQSDLFPKLKYIIEPEVALSPYPIWVERYTRAWGKLRNFGHLTIFEQASKGKIGYPLRFFGKNIEWLDKQPQAAVQIERDLHMLRAVFQDKKLEQTTTCHLEYANPSLTASKQNGLLLDVFKGNQINGQLSKDSDRHLKQLKVSQLDYPDLLKAENPFGVIKHFSLTGITFLKIEKAGNYWFRIDSDDGICVAINKRVVFDRNKSGNIRRGEFEVPLTEGLHRIDLRYFQNAGGAKLQLSWIPPGEKSWKPGSEGWEIIPESVLFLPD